jgi:spore coat protein U-like protein
MSKPIVKGIIAAAVAIATTTAFALQQENRTLSVTATIPGTCTLNTSGPMAFGNLNMGSGTAETHEVTVTYKCATGQAVTAFSVGGLSGGSYAGTMSALTPGNPDTIAYSIAWDPTSVAYTGQGFNVTGKQVILTGTIANSAYVTKRPDSYAHAVVLSIDY